MQRPSEHGLSAEEAVAHAQAEGLVLVRSEEGEGNSGFAGVEHVSRAAELQDCPYKAMHETTYLGYFGSAEVHYTLTAVTLAPSPTPTSTLTLILTPTLTLTLTLGTPAAARADCSPR